MYDQNIWRPTTGTDVNILISTKPHFFDETGLTVLAKVFELDQISNKVTFYFDGHYETDKNLIQYLDANPNHNIVFIKDYKTCRLDFGLVFGGDGSILWANRYLREYPYDLPVFTFNLGCVGFLSKFRFDELHEILDSVKALLNNELTHKQFFTEHYPKLYSVLVDSDGNEIRHFSSINEVLIEKTGSYSNWLEVCVDDIQLMTLNADGLILCTQLGSTAYNASVNGPFLFPSNNNFILSAIAPFAINFKSIVLDQHSRVSITISKGNYGSEVKVNSDGNDAVIMTKGESIRVTVGKERLNIIHCESNLKQQWVSKIAKLYKWTNN